MAGKSEKPQTLPPQQQEDRPGHESSMHPRPAAVRREYKGASKLENKVAIITGGDSGIGRAVAIAFAREGADVAIVYLDEHEDAEETRKKVESEKRRVMLISGDVGDPGFCRDAVRKVRDQFGRLDVLVNNAAEQHPQESILDITPEQLERTFRTNINPANKIP